MIENLGKNTYKYTQPSGHTVEIGNKDVSQFRPHIKFNKWDGECGIGLGFPDIMSLSPIINGDVITAGNTSYQFEWTPTSPKEGFNDEGGYDWRITLKKKPPVNSISFIYDASNVVAYHQPPLTQPEIDGGAIRPDHVVNSIAFYHSTKKAIHTSQTEANKYKCGKVGHLYRMKCTDSSPIPKTAWADWSLSDNIIILTIDQMYLNNAIYPVMVAPIGDTFGYTTAGSSQESWSANYILAGGTTYSPSSDGTGVSMSVCLSNGKNDKFKGAIYEGTTLIGETPASDTIPDETKQWVTANLSGSPQLNSASVYYLAFNINGTLTYWFDSETPKSRYKNSNFALAFPNPITWDDTNYDARKVSIYCTYTLAGPTKYIRANEFPMHYYETTQSVEELRSKVSDATVSNVAKDFPRILVEAAKSKTLTSKWS